MVSGTMGLISRVEENWDANFLASRGAKGADMAIFSHFFPPLSCLEGRTAGTDIRRRIEQAVARLGSAWGQRLERRGAATRNTHRGSTTRRLAGGLRLRCDASERELVSHGDEGEGGARGVAGRRGRADSSEWRDSAELHHW